MVLKISSVADVNSVFFIKSLRPAEDTTTQIFSKELKEYLDKLGVPFQFFEPVDHDALGAILDQIAEAAKAGAKPMLQLYMHGNATDGLFIAKSQEFFDWELLSEKLRAINVASGNNLCVISAVCFGMNVIKYNSIHEVVMAYALIAPKEKIFISFVEKTLIDFYKHVFGQLDLYGAYEKHLANTVSLLHCERLLAIVMTRHFKFECMGEAIDLKIMALLESAIKAGVDINEQNIESIRAMLRRELAPSKKTFEKYARSFLGERQTNLTFEQIMHFVQTPDKET